MANNLFNALNGQQTNPMSQLVTEARRLKKTMQNPRAEVERLLQSGQMSQSQFNQFAQIANQIIGSGAFK
jgi:hypothetical protein